MADISAQAIKELRDRTGAGIVDCKKALGESQGDLEKAIEYLRKTGLAKAAKRAGRAAKEGRLACVVQPNAAVFVEMLSETDFVAKNEKFGEYVQGLAKRAAEFSGNGDITEAVTAGEKDRMAELANVFGEDLRINRVLRHEISGKLGHYIHFDGRQGAMVEASGEVDADLLKNLAMHIVLKNPTYLSFDAVPAAVLEKEKEIASARSDLAGKPAAMVEKIVEGAVRKWSQDSCLLQQTWWKDEKLTVEKVLGKAKLTWFVRWQIGEGA
jgi:elongation factor Ts